MATAEQHADHDHERDLRKHEWRPGDRMPLDQRLAVCKLIGYAEGIAASGILNADMELRLRGIIAEALVAFDMRFSNEVARLKTSKPTSARSNGRTSPRWAHCARSSRA